ncbi:MAG: HAD-IC family P-type ATPase [Eubacterium sp.]|nr:HAD-IC family P-type ATPase [Eubacterium sp.]
MNTTTRTVSQIIRAHTLTYFNLLNVILAGFILISGQYKNMLFMGIVISNSLIGIIQELKVKSLIDQLSVITATKAKKVINDGQIVEIPIEDLVVGDIICISTGDQLVADGEVQSSEGLEVNESLLSGESVPVLKKPGDILYSGSFVVAGTGTGKVTHTGEDSYAVQLVQKAQSKRRATSEMQDAINRIIHYVSYAIIPIGIALFCIQYFRAGATLSNALVNTVAGVLGMIPEGLVLLTSVSFILGVGRLARKRALVQEMEAIEALARVNVLCLDKTGTITTGELTVKEVIPLNATMDDLTEVMDSMAFAFTETNSTSKALQQYFHDTCPLAITESLPFSSSRKFMGISTASGHFLLGAPDFLTKDTTVLEQAEIYSRQGLRVLLLGSCPELYRTPESIKDFHCMGLLILSDDIKEDALDTFRFFAKQGVSVKVVSGDAPATVSYIAGQAGIPGAEDYVDATILPEDPEALKELVPKYTVFGRVTPEKKQAIIHAYQANGDIVGMVGDGINDVLALKDSDCGIAMANGADAAKQTAHIVLMDSNFASMTNIVKEGRTTIANIERVSALYLTKTIYSVLLCTIFIIIGKSYPFIPIQLSLIGAAAIGIPSFFLALEQHEEPTSSGFLRHVLQISLPAALLLSGCICAIQFLAAPLHMNDLLIRTLNLLIGGVISLGVVVRVCHPFTKRRILLLLCICIIFAGALLFAPHFFGVMSIKDFIQVISLM